MDKKKIVTHESEIRLGINAIPCYVLDDGTRVLSGRGMQDALRMIDDSQESSGGRLGRYLGQKTLEPFLYREKMAGHYDPIVCYKGNQNNFRYLIIPSKPR
jgi:hypothetical protein